MASNWEFCLARLPDPDWLYPLAKNSRTSKEKNTVINWTQILTIANLLILLAVTFGGYFALKSALARSEIDVQTRVREALSAENKLLQSRVERLEKEKKQFEDMLQLVIAMLKKTHHIEIEVDGDIVTLRSQNGTHVGRITPSP